MSHKTVTLRHRDCQGRWTKWLVVDADGSVLAETDPEAWGGEHGGRTLTAEYRGMGYEVIDPCEPVKWLGYPSTQEKI
jgi:hypothetical protein